MALFLPWKTFLLLTVAIINMTMAFFIYRRGKEYKANVWYARFLFVIALWSFLLGLFYYAESDYPLLMITRLCYFTALFIALFFFVFANFFLTEERKIPRKTEFLTAIPTILLGGLVLFGNLIIDYVGYEREIKTVFLNKYGYSLYVINFSALISLAYRELLKKYKTVPPAQKNKLLFIIFGTLFPFIGGMIFSLILPWFTFKYMWAGPIFSVITAVVFVYAIVKYQILEIKLITAEILTFIIWLILFVKIIFAPDIQTRLLDVGIFGITLVFGAFLIKSVLGEVKQKEQNRLIAEHLERVNRELRELDAAKSEFISIAAHQLRTPLTVNKGYISMLVGGDYGKLTKEEKEVLEKIFFSNERLIRLVGDLLDISKIETGKLQFAFQPTDVVEMVSSIVEELKKEAEDSKLYLKFAPPKEKLPQVSADGLKLRQVVSNLIDNAVKYTQEGGIEVSVELKRPPERIFIKISDSGVGLTDEEIGRLFQKFVRTEDGKKTHAGGTGLGLYVARIITEAHKGKIWAESEGKGKGSSFCVELPAIRK